jgi:hypothetical protein
VAARTWRICATNSASLCWPTGPRAARGSGAGVFSVCRDQYTLERHAGHHAYRFQRHYLLQGNRHAASHFVDFPCAKVDRFWAQIQLRLKCGLRQVSYFGKCCLSTGCHSRDCCSTGFDNYHPDLI